LLQLEREYTFWTEGPERVPRDGAHLEATLRKAYELAKKPRETEAARARPESRRAAIERHMCMVARADPNQCIASGVDAGFWCGWRSFSMSEIGRQRTRKFYASARSQS
jgi:hypothetical protein